MRVQADAKADLESLKIAKLVWESVLRKVRKQVPSKYELVTDNVLKTGYIYRISTRTPKLVKFTLILRARSTKQFAAYYGKRGVDIIELNVLPKSKISKEVILKKLETTDTKNSFVHEFIHYLDTRKFKSKKHYEQHVREIEYQAKRGNVDDKQYFNFDLERNTHYVEIINQMTEKIAKPAFRKRVADFKAFMKAAKKLQPDFFKNLDAKNLRRITSRLYGVYILWKETKVLAKDYIAIGGMFVGASDEDEEIKKASGGKLLTEEYIRGLGSKHIEEVRRDGLISWNELQKSRLFPQFAKPPKGYLRACRCGIYITCENGDQYYTKSGIRGYSAMYVTPFDKWPVSFLERDGSKFEFRQDDGPHYGKHPDAD